MKAATLLNGIKRSFALLLMTLLLLMTFTTPALAAKQMKPPSENVPPITTQGEALPIETALYQACKVSTPTPPPKSLSHSGRGFISAKNGYKWE